MWYEIVPTFLIITASIALPCFAAGGLHKFFTGNSYWRAHDTDIQRRYYRRDIRINDDPYKLTGLETIPDEQI